MEDLGHKSGWTICPRCGYSCQLNWLWRTGIAIPMTSRVTCRQCCDVYTVTIDAQGELVKQKDYEKRIQKVLEWLDSISKTMPLPYEYEQGFLAAANEVKRILTDG